MRNLRDKILRVICLILIPAFFLQGCGTQIPPFHENNMRTIQIDPNVKMPKTIDYIPTKTPGEEAACVTAGMFMGAMGLYAASNSIAQPKIKKYGPLINKCVIDNHIDFGKTLIMQFKKQLPEKGIQAVDQNADAKMVISVIDLSLTPQGVVGNQLGASARISVKILRANRVVWEAKDFSGALDRKNTTTASIGQIINRPQLISQMFNDTAVILVREILAQWQPGN